MHQQECSIQRGERDQLHEELEQLKKSIDQYRIKRQEQQQRLTSTQKQLDLVQGQLDLDAKEVERLELTKINLLRDVRELESKKSKLDNQRKSFDEKEKSLEEKANAMELEEKRKKKCYEEQCKQLKSKEIELNSKDKLIEEREKEFEGRLKICLEVLCGTHSKLSGNQLSLITTGGSSQLLSDGSELNGNDISDSLQKSSNSEKHDLEKQIEENLKEFDSMKIDFEGKLKDLELTKAEFEGRMKELDMMKAKFEDRMNEFDTKDKKIDGIMKELEFKEKQIEGRMKDLDLKREEFEVRLKELDAKEKVIEERTKDFLNFRSTFDFGSYGQAPQVLYGTHNQPGNQLSLTSTSEGFQLLSHESEFNGNDLSLGLAKHVTCTEEVTMNQAEVQQPQGKKRANEVVLSGNSDKLPRTSEILAAQNHDDDLNISFSDLLNNPSP